MFKIAIVVLTYNRPAGIIKLLNSLVNQKIDTDKIFIKAFVVDNDINASSRGLILEYAQSNPNLSLDYIHEPNQGIPIARNTGLKAVPDGFQFVCFVDDDEYADQYWIDTLLSKQIKLNADCIAGKVIPVFHKNVPDWVVKSNIFSGWEFAEEKRIEKAASNNVLISRDFIKNNNLLFSENMRFTGGSDFHFFKTANKLGMKIFWTNDAIVYEDIPESRTKFRWLIQRQIRLGNTYSVCTKLNGSKVNLMLLAFKGIFRMILGIFLFPFSIFSYSLIAKSVIHILRGWGMFIGVSGFTINEYSKKNLFFDRKK